MGTLVAYTSKYGSTRQYAEWIASDLGADLREAGTVCDADIAAHDTVVVGGYLHIGKIIGADFLVKHQEALKPKKVFLFSVAGAPADDPQRKVWFEGSVPVGIRKHVTHFPLQGRAMVLDWKDSFLMLFPRASVWLAYRLRPTPENKKAYEGFRPFDGVKREAIQPLVRAVKNVL